MKKMDHYEQRLRDRLRELTDRLENAESELDQPSNPDADDRATEREGDEVLESIGSAGVAEMRMIKAALDRIAAGTFGKCVSCGEPISQARLEAVPHAARCQKCA